MIQHLVAVLWEDHWKPWLKDFFEIAGYVLGAATITVGIVMAWIYMEILAERLIG